MCIYVCVYKSTPVPPPPPAAGVLRLGPVRGQQSDLLHDSGTELPVQLVMTAALRTLGSASDVCLSGAGFYL